MKSVTYKTNHSVTSKSLTEWYFGKSTVANLTKSAIRMNKKTGETSFRFWQDGTGFLTIELN